MKKYEICKQALVRRFYSLNYINQLCLIAQQILNILIRNMQNLKNTYFWKRLKSKYYSFLFHESTPPPLLYFLIFAYFHFPFQPIPASFNVLFFGLAVKILLVSNFNCLFLMAPFLNAHPLMVLPMVAVCLFSCNEKWKVYLFILAIGDSSLKDTWSNIYFIAIFSAFICFETYRILVFRSVSENRQYFIGMVAVSAYYWMQIVEDYFGINNQATLAVPLVVAASLFAGSIMEYRIRKMREGKLNKSLSEREAAHFIKELEKQLEASFSYQLNLNNHTKSCVNVDCFCRYEELKDKPEYLIRNIYGRSIQIFGECNDCLLYEYYIDFLLKNQQIINALLIIVKWQPKDYFSFTARCRSMAKTEKYLIMQNTSNVYEHEYMYALQYDKHCLFVAVEINKILKLKLKFWNEINKQCPRVIRLQKLGYEIIDRMYELNIFYSHTIKPYEKKIFVFDSTVLYAMYMLSTTNFKQYAEIIIKNTAKLLQEVYIFQNSASQTFSIQTVMKNDYDNFVDHAKQPWKLLQQKQKPNKNTPNKLIIHAVSLGLCKILRVKKDDLMDQQLITMIPEGYKSVHQERLNQIFTFNDAQSSSVMDESKIIHRQLKLPIRGGNGQLVMGFVCIKLLASPELGITFISIIKLVRDRSSNILIDFSGKITQMQQGFNQEILLHSEVKKYLNKLRNTWIREKKVVEQKFSLMMNAANYIISINSPYMALFQANKNFVEHPPIHIEVINEETVKNRNLQTDKNNKAGRQIKHMETALHDYDASESTNSVKGGASAVNILTVFSQNNTVQLYRLLYLTFAAIITCCIISNIGAYVITELPWDPTVPTNNPINDTMNLHAIKMLTIKGLITLNDQITYFQEPNLNTTRIAQYFGFQNYTSSVINFTRNLQSAYKQCLKNVLRTPSNYLKGDINRFLSNNVAIPDPPISNAPTTYQNIRYEEAVLLYASDFELMTQLKLNSTILKLSYSPTIAQAQNASHFSALIDRGVSEAQKISIIVHISLIAFSILLLIPLFCLLRRRLSLHEKIFDLLVSIDAKQVQNQIKSLQYISNILRNFKESNQIMKMNVLDYEQNVIHPKAKPRGSRSSVDNQMMLGLEKYDINHQNSDVAGLKQESVISRNSIESFKITSNIKKRQRGHSKVGNLIKSKFVSTKQENTNIKRKRAGQLDMEGSILDPNNRLIGSHCIIYTISISFLAFLIVSVLLNLNFNGQYTTLKNNLLNTYNQQIIFEQYLLTIKVYLVQGGLTIQQVFNVTNQLEVLLADLNAIPSYNYNDGDTLYSTILPNCTNGTVFIQKYCQLNYSQIVLKGQFGALFKELTELRYAYDHDLPLYQTPNVTLLNIKEKFYYLESLNIRLQELVLNKVDLIFQSIIDLSTNYGNMKLLLLVVSVIWGLLSLLIGMTIEISMKEGYFKEVFMITFLNNEMILTNKRVESFLESIAKNSSS